MPVEYYRPMKPMPGEADIIVQHLQAFLYMEEGGTWNPDKEVNGGDLVDYLNQQFAFFNLAPQEVVVK